MKQSLVDKLQQLVARSEELGALLSDPDVINDQNRFRDLSKEYAQLESIVDLTRSYEHRRKLTSKPPRRCSKTTTPNSVNWARKKSRLLKRISSTIELDVRKELIPKDPYDDSNLYLEIRAGTGGDEAAIFAGDLFRMYLEVRRVTALASGNHERTARANTAVTRKSSAASSATAPIRN